MKVRVTACNTYETNIHESRMKPIIDYFTGDAPENEETYNEYKKFMDYFLCALTLGTEPQVIGGEYWDEKENCWKTFCEV